MNPALAMYTSKLQAGQLLRPQQELYFFQPLPLFPVFLFMFVTRMEAVCVSLAGPLDYVLLPQGSAAFLSISHANNPRDLVTWNAGCPKRRRAVDVTHGHRLRGRDSGPRRANGAQVAAARKKIRERILFKYCNPVVSKTLSSQLPTSIKEGRQPAAGSLMIMAWGPSSHRQPFVLADFNLRCLAIASTFWQSTLLRACPQTLRPHTRFTHRAGVA